MKTLILYSYRDYPDSAINFNYFIDKTLPLLSNEIDLLVAYNTTTLIEIQSSSERVKYFQTPYAFDINDFSFLLSKVDIQQYDIFIFLNSSCIGPILPTYVEKNWVQIISNNITTTVKITAPVVEVPPDDLGTKCLTEHLYIDKKDTNIPFVHTYFFATDLIGLNILIKSKAISNIPIDKDDAILHFERKISSSILNEGYNIKSLMKVHEGISWLDKQNWNSKLWSLSTISCPEVPRNYFGADLSPYELIFFKNIRHPHKHRGADQVGIAEHNKIYLQNIILK